MQITPLDAPKPRYIVVVRHDEYEQTVVLFIDKQTALEYGPKTYPGADPSDIYVAEII